MAGSQPQVGRRNPRDEGQVLVLFCISIVAMLIALALLYDGARALVLRRQLHLEDHPGRHEHARPARVSGRHVLADRGPPLRTQAGDETREE